MELQEAIALIQHDSLSQPYHAAWADLGCGSGLFSQALARLLAPGGVVHAIDREPVDIQPVTSKASIRTLQLDFVANEWPLQDLDGILMANSLHYVSDQPGFIRKAGRYLKPGGHFLVVEYDTDQANRWVPYPLSYLKLIRLFSREGYTAITRLQERPSVYGRANLYAVLITSPDHKN
ncbi:class I SAM-dependent methyltransferase [Chitinophaga japonensis]|uniref:Methyltransferase family protein n=1 Tax=Chitinophaga japonensis TaxID=104662 RepID=A0A562TD66_CHIJA|nr:class I SAM-dependent methyltransferase [Chitinophaga japonensis]TWI91016.1 methyltransferase family protein [Chitinophaga japonensis]